MEKNNIKEQLTKLLFLKNLPNLLYEFQKNNIILGNNKYSNLNTNIKKQDNKTEDIPNKTTINNNSTKLKINKNIGNNISADKGNIRIYNNNLNYYLDNKNQQFIRYNKQIKFDVNLELSEKNSSSKKNKTNSKSKNKLANGKNPIFIIRKSPNKKNKSYYFQSKKRKRSFKNNKLVFIQLDQGIENTKENIKNNCLEEKELSDQKKLLKLQKDIELIHTNTKSRRSKYRGVSKNGSQWQVLIMIKKKKNIWEVILMKKKQQEYMINMH